MALGQCSQVQVYSYTGVIVAGDGSLKKDGSMGTAMLQRHLVAQGGRCGGIWPGASTRPAFTAFIMALKDSPGDEDLTLLTDSASSMKLLQRLPSLALTAYSTTAVCVCGEYICINTVKRWWRGARGF